MHFLRRLNPAFEQRSAVLLAQTRIPSPDEAIAAMIQGVALGYMLRPVDSQGCNQH